jgi:hypothetical protein
MVRRCASVLLGCGSNSLMAGSRTYRACYIAIPLYICGFVVLGAALQKHESVGAVVMGWGISQVAIMVNTVAVCASIYARLHAAREDSRSFPLDAYTNDCFPRHQGEISALINLARVLGGFSVAYFQVPWATKHGALETFGCEAA